MVIAVGAVDVLRQRAAEEQPIGLDLVEAEDQALEQKAKEIDAAVQVRDEVAVEDEE